MYIHIYIYIYTPLHPSVWVSHFSPKGFGFLMVKAVKGFKFYILGVELLLAMPFSDCDFFVSMFVVKSKAAGNSNS